MDKQHKPGRAADALGEPALLLVESLIHELVERGTLARDDAIDIVDTALAVQIALLDDRDEDAATCAAVAALSKIQATFAIGSGHVELGGDDRPPPDDDRDGEA